MYPKLYEDMFTSAEMRAVFSDANLVRTMLQVEAALGFATAAAGLIPEGSALVIADACRLERIDIGKVKDNLASNGGHPVMALLAEIRAASPEAARYIHWGATTQDIIDTSAVMQLRDAMRILDRDLERLVGAAVTLAQAHAVTVMAGRTHGVHAVPTTFGAKAVGWAAELQRHRERLAAKRPRLSEGSVSGAVGNFASFGGQGERVQRVALELLSLRVPDVPWQNSRDRFSDLMTLLGMIAATNARICREVVNLMRTEIQELEEPDFEGKIASSTMPQKRNPSVSELVITLERLVRSRVMLALECMQQEHERDAVYWFAEWVTIPDVCIFTARSLELSIAVLEGLRVNRTNMERNMGLTGGLIFAESVMLGLARDLGRHEAHERLYAASRRAVEQGIGLQEALQIELGAGFDATTYFDAGPYIEGSRAVVDKAVRALRAARLRGAV